MGEAISLCTGITDSAEEKIQKKYKVVGYNGATLREQESLDSKFVTKLPQGAVVIVDKISERRVHISSPVQGWSSLHTTSSGNPLVILEPIENE